MRLESWLFTAVLFFLPAVTTRKSTCFRPQSKCCRTLILLLTRIRSRLRAPARRIWNMRARTTNMWGRRRAVLLGTAEDEIKARETLHRFIASMDVYSTLSEEVKALFRQGALGPAGDADGDGWPNSIELARGTNQFDSSDAPDRTVDSDADGFSDSWELHERTSPADTTETPSNRQEKDSDGDGQADGYERLMHTNPFDGLDFYFLNGLLRDMDGDGFSDSFETANGTSKIQSVDTPVNKTDTDGDGESDFYELLNGTNPQDRMDTHETKLDEDRDGESNSLELANSTNPNDPVSNSRLDIDGDGLPDKIETAAGSNAFDSADLPGGLDTDGDGESDSFERLHGSNPNNKDDSSATMVDTDQDGESDDYEKANGTDPMNAKDNSKTDTDSDGISDVVENQLGTDFDVVDSDGDGFSDGEELKLGTDPKSNASKPAATPEDSDGDGIPNDL